MQKRESVFLGLPYDFRRPTWDRVQRRMWNPGGPMWSPHVWGWGYTLNLAHWGSWALTAGIALLAMGVV